MTPSSENRTAFYEYAILPVSALKIYKRNPRKHLQTQIDQIKRSIASFGFTNPLLVDEGLEIIAGHARYLAAKELGLTDIPVIIIRGLNEAQKRALRIADNKLAENSSWDTDLLRLELGDIQAVIEDLTIIGFEQGEIDKLLAVPIDADEDSIPAIPEAAVTRVGDLWQLGPHHLICGDCRDAEVMTRLMDGRTAQAMFSDPPYNVKIDGHAGGKGKVKHREFAMASGEMSSDEFVTFLRDCLTAAAAVSDDGAVHFVCMDHHHLDDLLNVGREIYPKRLNICVWNKSNAGMGTLYRSKHEMVCVFRVGEAQHRNNVQLGKHGRNRTNVWDYASVNTFGGSRQQDLKLHPTVKPAAMVSDAIADVTLHGEIVLDPFMGSGTTLIAADRVGRIAYGVEIDPGYVDVILQRYAMLSGVDPILTETGETLKAVASRRGQAGEA